MHLSLIVRETPSAISPPCLTHILTHEAIQRRLSSCQLSGTIHHREIVMEIIITNNRASVIINPLVY